MRRGVWIGLAGGLALGVGLGLAACAAPPTRPVQKAPASPASVADLAVPAARSTAVSHAAASRSSAPAPEESPSPAEDARVEFSFDTTVTAAAPGNSFWLVAHLTLPPGYRVFWVNPGDMGRPTRVEFHVPDGFEAGEVLFPPPRKFELSDSGVAYGYEGETAAFVRVRAQADLDTTSDYRFEVEASWLACNEQCYPENTTAFIELGASDRAPEHALSPPLAHLKEALPQQLTDLTGVSYRWRRGGRLQVTAAKTTWLDFLPEHPDDPKLVEVNFNAKRDELKLRFSDGTPGSRVRGLAIADSPHGPRYVSVDIPWPERSRRTAQ